MPDINKTDLVARLRDQHDGWSGDAFCVSGEVASEAADAIEALMSERVDKAEAWDAIAAKNAIIASQAAEISRLRDALSDINNMETGWANATVKRMVLRARTALEANHG